MYPNASFWLVKGDMYHWVNQIWEDIIKRIYTSVYIPATHFAFLLLVRPTHHSERWKRKKKTYRYIKRVKTRKMTEWAFLWILRWSTPKKSLVTPFLLIQTRLYKLHIVLGNRNLKEKSKCERTKKCLLTYCYSLYWEIRPNLIFTMFILCIDSSTIYQPNRC